MGNGVVASVERWLLICHCQALHQGNCPPSLHSSVAGASPSPATTALLSSMTLLLLLELHTGSYSK